MRGCFSRRLGGLFLFEGVFLKNRLHSGGFVCLGVCLQFGVDFGLGEVVGVVAQSCQGYAHYDFDCLLPVVARIEKCFEFVVGYCAFFAITAWVKAASAPSLASSNSPAAKARAALRDCSDRSFFRVASLVCPATQKPHWLVRAA